MTKKKNYEKFEKVFEAYYSKYAAGIFAPNDVIEIDVEKMKKHDSYKKLQPQLQAKLLTMAEAQAAGDAVICVVAIDINPFIHDTYAPSTMSIGYSLGGGRFDDIIAIPGSLCDCITLVEDPIGNQVSLLPPNARVEYPARTEPKAVDLDELEKNRTKGTAATIFDPNSKITKAVDSND